MSYIIWPKGRKKIGRPDMPDADGETPCTASSPDSRFVCSRAKHSDGTHVTREVFTSAEFPQGRLEQACEWLRTDKLGSEPSYRDRNDAIIPDEASANEGEKTTPATKDSRVSPTAVGQHVKIRKENPSVLANWENPETKRPYGFDSEFVVVEISSGHIIVSYNGKTLKSEEQRTRFDVDRFYVVSSPSVVTDGFAVGNVVTFRDGVKSETGLSREKDPDSGKMYGEIEGIEMVVLSNDGANGDITVSWNGKRIGIKHVAYKRAGFKPLNKSSTTNKDTKMALTGKSDNGAEEIVYGEKVSFSVDGGKFIEINTEAEAIEWIQRRAEEREKEIQLIENIEGSYPSDGMLSLARVLRRDFGFTRFDSPNPFGKPVVFTIPTDCNGGTADCPWGKFAVPGISGFMQTAVNMDKSGQPIFQIVAKVKNKDKDKVKDLCNRVRADLRKNSIYKGKAIKVDFPDFNEVPFDPTIHLPQFLDVRGANPDRLIYSDRVREQIETSIFTPIIYTDVHRSIGENLKRGVLLSGAPGTGKTMAAYATAHLCEENGWTFIYLSNTTDFSRAIGFAKMYQPAVIFAEDLDSIICNDTEDEDRDEGSHKLLNTLDGVDTKTSEIMVVFTTNYPDKISKVMLRPGRLDAVIEISPPDSIAAEKLVRLYGNGLVDPSEDLSSVGVLLNGMIPAVIREVVKRAKLRAIPRVSGNQIKITARDLVYAADSMNDHLAMLNRKRKMEPSDIEKAAIAVAERFATGLAFTGAHPDVRRLADHVLENEKSLPSPEKKQ